MIDIEIPGLRLVSEMNSREHWRARARRAATQRKAVLMHLRARAERPAATPLRVTITRVAPRRLDSDNAVTSGKHVRDAVADWLGIDDRRDDLVRYEVTQEQRPKAYAVRVRIEEVGA